MMNILTTKNTQDSSSTAAGADAATKEIRQATTAEEKNMEEYIQTMLKLIKATIIETTSLQKNVSNDFQRRTHEAARSFELANRVTAGHINGPPMFERKEKDQAQG